MAQGRSTKIISMIKWIRTSRLSIKNSLSVDRRLEGRGAKRELPCARCVLALSLALSLSLYLSLYIYIYPRLLPLTRLHTSRSYLPPPHLESTPRTMVNNHFTEMCGGTEASSYLRLIDSFITQLKAQGPFRTCNESKEEDGEEDYDARRVDTLLPASP